MTVLSPVGLRAVANHRVVAVGLIVLAQLTLCLTRVRDAYDIFIDEVTYTRLADSIATGNGVTLDGVPFNLHPPAALGIFGAVLNVFGRGGDLEHQLLDLRPVSAVFGALAGAGAYLLVRQAADQRYALAAAALVGLSPFVILYNSEVMLEAPAQAAAVAMFCFLAAATCETGATTKARWYIGGAGVFGGLVVCTKETFGLVVIATLLILLATNWVLPRRHIALVLVIAATGYAGYVVAVGLTTGFASWWSAQFAGIRRLVGADQQTGFNAASTQVSFLSRLLANAASNGVTYALLGLGFLATLLLLRRFRPWRPAWRSDASARERVGLLITIWSLAAGGYLSYAILFGTLEAQMFYIMVLPAVAALCVWASLSVPSWPQIWQRVCAGVLALALLINGAVWIVVHTGPTGAYQQFLAWELANVPPGSIISVTEDVAQFLIRGAVLGDWHTIAALQANHVDYILLSTTLVDQGYGSATKSFQTQLESRATLAFQSTGSGQDGLRLYCVCGVHFAAP